MYGVVHIGCILFKAITYLQSAYRLKGEDAVEADDITEIAGVDELAHLVVVVSDFSCLLPD